MKQWLVQVNGVYYKVGSSIKPIEPSYEKVVEVKDSMLSEDPRWLQIEDIDDGEGNLVPTVTINQPLKSTLQTQDAIDNAAALDAANYEVEVQKKIARLDFGKRMMAEIAVLNDTKAWTVPQTLNYMSDPRVQSISALLSTGAIESARDTIVATDLSSYYSTEDKDGIVLKMTGFLDNE